MSAVRVLSWLGRHLLTFSLVFAGCFALPSKAQERPPVVPLVTHDPYFSIWSMSDHLTDINTRHWTGTEQPLAGLIRIDNVPYRYMGADPRQVPAMPQVSLQVTPLHTIYAFETAGVRLQVTFFTAAFPNDLDALARPVDYLTWNIASTDGRAHAVDLLLDVSPVVAVDTNDQDVTWGRSALPGMQVLRVGSRDQRVLNRQLLVQIGRVERRLDIDRAFARQLDAIVGGAEATADAKNHVGLVQKVADGFRNRPTASPE